MPPRDVVRSRRLTHAGLLKEQGWGAVWASAYGSLRHFDRQPVARSIWPAGALRAPPRTGTRQRPAPPRARRGGVALALARPDEPTRPRSCDRLGIPS